MNLKNWLRRLCKSSDAHVLSIRSALRLTVSLLFSKLIFVYVSFKSTSS
ncbi:unknown [Rickettsia bellii RML369-C]|uniref:Uncharacterized protein n=1 Tax=Rickettsia bellii (strain RML369-C) TaxID=336407 RepID=Q1RHZ0_RICBR|nr:unknown [Rickettsia bellii RML369-C]ABV79143.1 hypothetical protein A1I_03950 [Rickettsia bellii OSU 85-389]